MATVVASLLRDTPLSVIALVALAICIAVTSLTSPPSVPRELQWVGKKAKGPLSNLRAAIECLRHPKEALREGYEKFHKSGDSYIFPMFGGAPEIVIPNEKLSWLLNFPDNEVSASEAHYDLLAGDYAFTSPHLLHHTFHEDVIHRTLSRKLPILLPHIWEEIQFQVDRNLGHNTNEDKDIVVLDSMTAIVAGVSNRLFVGLPLCRNLKFLDLVMKFASGVIFVVAVLNLFPRLLQPIIGHLASIPNHVCIWRSKKYLLPLIKKRLAEIEEEDANPSAEGFSKIPEDYLTWQIRHAKKQENELERDPDWIARRLMPLEFAAIHTTSLTIANLLLDLLGSDPKHGYIEAIREEVERIYREHQGVWSKQALAQLIRTDSAIRESMRISSFNLRGVQRKVIAKSGIEFKEGWTAPYGSIISTDIWTRHHDPNVYPEPFFYDAFRFSRPREESNEHTTSENYVKMQNLSLTSTDADFLPFGHGRHACPGRFFVNVELKMLMAYLVMNYDFEMLEKRPEMVVMGGVILPPSKAAIRFRRRSCSMMGHGEV